MQGIQNLKLHILRQYTPCLIFLWYHYTLNVSSPVKVPKVHSQIWNTAPMSDNYGMLYDICHLLCISTKEMIHIHLVCYAVTWFTYIHITKKHRNYSVVSHKISYSDWVWLLHSIKELGDTQSSCKFDICWYWTFPRSLRQGKEGIRRLAPTTQNAPIQIALSVTSLSWCFTFWWMCPTRVLQCEIFIGR